MLPLHWKTALAAALCVAASSQPGLAQVPSPTILEVDLDNKVQYHEDASFDPSKFATIGGATTVIRALNFGKFVSIADIVAVNGQPAKGIAVYNTRVVTLRAAPANPGEGIADTDRNGVIDQMFEILTSDGVAVGTILSSGLAAGAAPPGSPQEVVQGNLAILGGTGAFFGARGSVGQGPTTVADRIASMTEDPGSRRKNGGGKVRIVVRLIPLSQPQIVTAATGPAIFHSDFTPVTAARPTKSGEVLIVTATGLGPTVPGVNSGQPFPSNAILQVNSPLAVTVNGKPAEVINGIGWPGQVDTYRVDFRVSDGIVPGMASVQLTAAWITGSAVGIPVQ